jgi:hypothetical protein
VAAVTDAAADPGLPAGLPADAASLRRLDLLLRAAIAGIAAVEDEAAERGLALRAGVVFDDDGPVVLIHLIAEARPLRAGRAGPG